MFVYLSKKIAIPNNFKVKCVGWSYEHGFIACGGESALLKVIKLDTGGGDDGPKSFVAPKNLSMNQTLDGHSGAVTCCCWNELYQKLTTSDDSGLIIVWMLYKGSWYEEMINNRNKSVVTGMAWSADGQKICIVYEDGAVIVGSVDGNRVWGKDIKAPRMAQVEWSPDNKMLLVGIQDTEVHVYDEKGNFMSKVSLPVIQGAFGRMSGSVEIAKLLGIKWHRARNFDNHGLAIGFENGRIQLMKNECDETPIIINSNLVMTDMKWNFSGTVLAITGHSDTVGESGQTKERSHIKFYDNHGELLQTLRVPGKEINGCSWEKESLRIAMAVDCYIYFANIRPDYSWACFSSTIVFCLSVEMPREEYEPVEGAEARNKLVFWNMISKEKQTKTIRNLVAIAGHGHHCVLVTRSDESLSGGGLSSAHAKSSLVLCNAIGTPIDSVNVSEDVSKVVINSTQVVASARDSFVVWTFTSLSSHSATSTFGGLSKQDFTAFKYDIDDTDEFERTSRQRGSSANSLDNKLVSTFVSRSDPIACIAISEKILVVGLEAGKFEVYLLPKVTPIHSFSLGCQPHKIVLNCDSSKLAIIETNSVALIYDMEAQGDASAKSPSQPGKLLEFEKKDVWDVKWASDNSEMFAIIEKNKLMIFNGIECEEAGYAAGYLAQFEDLVIRTVNLDTLVNEIPNDAQNLDNYTNVMETKMLKDARGILEKVGLSEASNFIEEMGHPRLWRLLAESALRALDLQTAELALVRCKDFKGIQFVKKISKLQNDSLKRAEVYAYFGEFEDAEKVYLDCDRRDLAINMRNVLGDYNRVVELMKGDLGARNDDEMKDVLSKVGDYYADRLQWTEAVDYYEESGNLERLFDAYCAIEDFDGLKNLVVKYEPGRDMLSNFGGVFESVGMCDEAVDAYVKAGQIEDAINCCVTLNEWKTAIQLAQENDFADIDPILSQYAAHLLSKKKFFDIVELYRKANRIPDAANMLLKIIEDSKRLNEASPVLQKKLYTLIGILYEEQAATNRRRDNSKRRNTLTSLLREDDGLVSAAANFRAIDQPWKGAEAFHLYMLAQRQLYDGYVDAAMKSALHLRDYEEFIQAEDIYTLIALSSCANRCFAICSKAFIKLESLDTNSDEKRTEYENLAVDIFTNHPPKESRNLAKAECTHCETMIPDYLSVCASCNTKFPICMASGRPIMDPRQQWTCDRCSHHACKAELVSFNYCPLCHYPISKGSDN